MFPKDPQFVYNLIHICVENLEQSNEEKTTESLIGGEDNDDRDQ